MEEGNGHGLALSFSNCATTSPCDQPLVLWREPMNAAASAFVRNYGNAGFGNQDVAPGRDGRPDRAATRSDTPLLLEYEIGEFP